MKRYIVILLSVLLSSCLTTENLTDQEILDLDVLTITTETKKNRILTKEDDELLKEFRQFALEGSDIISLFNNYNYSSLNTKNSPVKAKEDATEILDSFWSVKNREDYLIRINRLYISGMRSRYIGILNILLLKPEYLHDKDLLLEQDTWQEEIDNGIITLDDYLKIVYLINRADYTSFMDIHLFELERLSIMVRWGYAMDFITEYEAFSILEDIATEMSNFDSNWLDFGSSYVAGLTMLWYKSLRMEENISNRSMAVLNLINNYSWSKSDWNRLREISDILKDKKITTNDNLFRSSVKPPKLPKNIEVDPVIASLFDQNRKSQSYISKSRYSFELFSAIRQRDIGSIKKLLENRRDEINDIQMQTGTCFVYEAANSGNIKSVKLLLDSGFDPNLQNTGNKETALHIATEKKYSSIVKILLENGADPNFENDIYGVPLATAISDQNRVIVDLLLKHNANPTIGIYNNENPTFWGALRNNDQDIGLNVLNYIEDKTINERDAFTSLMMLLKANRQEEFKLLLNKSSNMEYRNEKGNHILYHTGSDPNFAWAAKILIDRGFTMELPGFNNFSYLSNLAYNVNYKLLLYVIDQGYDITSYDYNKMVPVMQEVFNIIEDKETPEYLNFIEELKERGIETP
ncbi:MAG: ankyrin repeat domain-containing protein [Spirochaetaceae bacterium]